MISSHRFHHPKADITSMIHATMPALSGEKVKLQEIGCQFHFISTPDEIKQLLKSFPPKISMYDTNGSAEPLSLSTLDVKPLFHQDKVVLLLYLQRNLYKIIKIKIEIFFSLSVNINYLCMIQINVKLVK